MRRLILLSVLALVFSVSVSAQITGLYSFGSFDNRGFDSVNIGNLNIHFSIPIVSKPGRGMPFYYNLSYDSLIWSPVNTTGTTTWAPTQSFGWLADTATVTGYVTYEVEDDPEIYTYSVNGHMYSLDCTNYIYQPFVYIDIFGVSHTFIGQTGDNSQCHGKTGINKPSFTATAIDGSGYKISVTNYTNVAITGPTGRTFLPPVNITGGGGEVTDSNGNQITTNGNGVFTDTLGTTALTVGGNGAANSPHTLTYNVAQQADSSTTATATVSYATYNVQTNFGCSGIAEYGPLSNDLVDRVTLADGTYYQFTYENTPGGSGTVTGRIASVRLPTGGTINYQYSAGCGNGMNADGTTGSLSRMTSDGTRLYGRAPTANGSATTLQDESGNQTVYTFTNTNGWFYETHRQIYQGTAPNQQLSDVYTCYNGAGPSCDGGTITLPITQVQVITSFNGGTQSRKVDTYDGSSGFLTSEQIHDYGDTLLQTTSYSYVSPGRVSGVTVQDGSNQTVSQVSYGYDEQAPTATSNIPQHTAVSGPRGNQTSASHWSNNSNGSITTHSTYDDTGQITAMKDGRGNTTSYTYDSATNGFLTNTAYPMANLTTSAQYDAASGVLLSTTDMNNQVTTYKYYDRLLRLAEVDYPDGGKTLYSRPSATEQSVSVLQQGSTYITSIYDSDGYGRQSQVTQHDPVAGDSYINYTYYPNGLLHTTTNPHRSAGSSTDGTTTYTYDALGRTTGVTLPDNTSQQLIYSSNTVTKQDASGSQWGYTMDALGRLIKVIEPNSAETDYAYSTFTTTVTQKGTSGETPRPARTFTVDSLGRTVTVVEPESGTTSYTYDNNSNLSTKTDARGITTTYNYDALNRVTSISYSDGTPGNYYTYDVAPGWMSDLQNIRGRLANSSNQYGGGTAGNATATAYSYDAMGRIVRTWEQTPSASPAGYFVYSKYDLAGNLTDLNYPDGRHITQSWDSAGHLNNVVFADWNGQGVNYSYWSSPTYYPNGSLHSVALGNGMTQTFNMNSRLQPIETITQLGATWSNQTVFDKQYCYGPAATGCPNFNVPNKGNIYGVNDALSAARYQGFSYDILNRLNGFSTGDSSLSQTYSYDSFGNMNQVAPGTLQSNLSFASNNRINSSGYTYDQAGNVTQTNNGAGTLTPYVYDAESRLSSINSGAANYIYNETGQRARKNVSGLWTEYFFFGGQPIAELHTDGTWSDYIYANGQRIAQADSFDARIHFTGTNCCGGQYSMYTIPVPGITIQSGDKVAWRQYQTGSAGPRGGLAISFPDGNTNWVTTDQNGQVMNDLTTQNSWVYRVADLSQYAGKTINMAWINTDTRSGSGDWQEYFADIALYRQDGTVIPVYHRQMNISYPAASSPGVSNTTFSIDRSNSSGDAMYATANTTYYVGDQIGSARMLLAGGGWPVSSSTFYPFGQETQNAGDPNHYKFTGFERDNESGLDHTQFRQYSSTQGRWMSPDPYDGSYDFSDPQSFNRYSYVRNNPLGMVDPSGKNGYCVGAFPYGTAESNQYTVNPSIVDSFTCTSNYGSWVDDGSSDTVANVNSNDSPPPPPPPGPDPETGPGIGAIPVNPSSSSGSGGGGGSSAPNKTVSSTPTTDPFPKRLFDTHWCGLGGAGPTVNQLDAACQAHDACYANNGLTAGMNWGFGITPQSIRALQTCNQNLCSAAAATSDPGSTRVQLYFQSVPYGFCSAVRR